ncbi:hypothetical protein G7Y89_g5603 [Cudoniella acicularis]|uniref:Transaldolase n=1 Tax=Cudoniella acicularis TaxID=354080 RepID=A0A8H4W3U1_9HELO|nr:hypothetical protein G7Y89_g5603 [Cudoniella acicularis]
MSRFSFFLCILHFTSSVLAATGSVYVTDLPAFSSLAPCAASAISYVVQGLTQSICPSGVTELVSCACTQDSNSAAIASSITTQVKDDCSSTATADITSALSVFSGYCNQGTAVAAAATTTGPAASGVTQFITDLPAFAYLAPCAQSGLSYAIQNAAKNDCPTQASGLQSCACTKDQNSLAASENINSDVSEYCDGPTHTADISSAQAVFAGYCGLAGGSSVFPSPSYLAGKMTYYITDLQQYSSLASCAQEAVSYEVQGLTRELCASAPMALVSCACVQDSNSDYVNSGLKTNVLDYCGSTASADVSSGQAVFDYYCSAGKGLVTPVGVTASVTPTGAAGTAAGTGVGATATSGSGLTGSGGSSTGSIATKIPITTIVGAAAGLVVVLAISGCFLRTYRRNRMRKVVRQNIAAAQANMAGPAPPYPGPFNGGLPITEPAVSPMTPFLKPAAPMGVVDNRPVSPMEDKTHSFVSQTPVDPRAEMAAPPPPNRSELPPQNEVIMANRAELHSASNSRVGTPHIPQGGTPVPELPQNNGQYPQPGQAVPMHELPPQNGGYQQQQQWQGQGPNGYQQQYQQQYQQPIEMQARPAPTPEMPGMSATAGPVRISHIADFHRLFGARTSGSEMQAEPQSRLKPKERKSETREKLKGVGTAGEPYNDNDRSIDWLSSSNWLRGSSRAHIDVSTHSTEGMETKVTPFGAMSRRPVALAGVTAIAAVAVGEAIGTTSTNNSGTISILRSPLYKFSPPPTSNCVVANLYEGIARKSNREGRCQTGQCPKLPAASSCTPKDPHPGFLKASWVTHKRIAAHKYCNSNNNANANEYQQTNPTRMLTLPRITHAIRAGRVIPTPTLPSLLCTRYASSSSTSNSKPQNRLAASYYRGGTSRALIFHRADLPFDPEAWSPIFLGALGSPDPNGRQLDGLGGGISSLSKICVVGPSTHLDADVDYTFAAIGVKNSEVDYSSNCGNMTSAIGPFAVDRGLFVVGDEEGDVKVRIHNTNTGKIIHASFGVVGGEATASGEFAIDGVAGTGSKIQLAFMDPAGSKTGKLLPTGNAVDVFDGVEASCIDAGNPCVFVRAESLGIDGSILPDAVDADPALLGRLEKIRCAAAVAMGINKAGEPTPGSIPKIAMVSPPQSHQLLSGERIGETAMDLVVRALSVGQPHRAVPITVSLAIAAATNIKGSTVQKCVSSERVDEDGITLSHPTGKMMVGAGFDERGSENSRLIRGLHLESSIPHNLNFSTLPFSPIVLIGQAIAYFELQKPEHKEIIQKSIDFSKKLSDNYPGIPQKELAVEFAMVYLQLAIEKHISGFVHVQTNPYHSYDTDKMVSDSKRKAPLSSHHLVSSQKTGILLLFKELDPKFKTQRVCFKIPSTWEGLQACKILQAQGITTLATTLFTLEQAALAGEVGCHYIAPYVNELKVHFEPGFVDHNKAQCLCLQAQRYYEKYGFNTKVLPASLTSTDEIMTLVGVNHITIAPGLLKELAEKQTEGLKVTSLFDEPGSVGGLGVEVGEKMEFGSDAGKYKIAFTRSGGGNGEGERKLVQTKLEDMMN